MTLLILAAGMGSRYGGLKQLDPVGPSGETLLDYSLFDAIRAGFKRVVFIIRRDFEAEFRQRVGQRYENQIDVDYVFQELSAVPAGFSIPATRQKPLGTGHAIWCARDSVKTPFAAINADDFYGRDSYRVLADFYAQPGADTRFAMVGYRLGRTLSEHGTVSRGICSVDSEGCLREIEECTNIERTASGAQFKRADGSLQQFTGNEIVSMNCWGFTPALFPMLEEGLCAFLPGAGEKGEFYIPSAVTGMIAEGRASVNVLSSESSWFGVTYREDKPLVTESIARLVAAGEYPERLL